MRDKCRAIIITSVAIKKQNSILYEGRFEKTKYIFISNFGLYFNRQKKYKIQSKNIIICCEFDAKIYLDIQHIKQFWYRASVSKFLLIAHAHVIPIAILILPPLFVILSIDAQALSFLFWLYSISNIIWTVSYYW